MPTIFDITRKVYICFMVNKNYRVELISPEGKESPIYSLLTKYKNTPYHICYCTHDLEDTIKNMLEHGFMIFQEPAVAPAIQNKKVVFMISPEIGIVEILKEY
ncbi:MAG: VOC family protein [Hydrogenoanaerobacterium sp.]